MVGAKNNLGGLYFEEKNYEKAIKYYEEAIVDGCREAIENIGDLYYQRDDIERAISYYLRNADTLSCQVKLGNIYEDGENLEEAIIWYIKASENNDIQANYKLGCMYEDMNDKQNAKKYFEIASEKSNINARIHLGRIYFEEENYEEAKKMFETPASEGNIYSQHMIGLIYDIFYKDYINSKYWYEKARSQQCVESIYNLGHLSLKLHEDSEAEKYYKEGFKQGNKKCEYMLAGLYYKKSLDMYKILAEQDYDNSKEIVNNMPKLSINYDEVLIAPFREVEIKADDEEYVPMYILEIEENLEEIFEDLITDMIIDIDSK